MGREPKSVGPDQLVEEAQRLRQAHKIDQIPVVDDSGRPVGLLDVAGFWQPLLTMVERMVDEGFVSAKHRRMLCVERDPVALLERMREWQAPEVATWVREREL